MTKNKIIKICGILLLLSVLFPPFAIRMQGVVREKQWGFLFSIPRSDYYDLPLDIDFATLLVEFILVGIVGGLLYLFKKK